VQYYTEASIDGELNPNHSTTRGVHGHWHKIAGLLMLHFGKTQVTIPLNEIQNLEGMNIAIRFDDSKGIDIFIVDDAEAVRLSRKEGGLPV
jgi:hypothetical protein